MKKLIATWFFVFICFFSYSQKLDLVVTVDGDSIACNIDSITANGIHFEMKFNNIWRTTFLEKEKIADYKLNIIVPPPKWMARQYGVFDLNQFSVSQMYVVKKELIRKKKIGIGLTLGGGGMIAGGVGLMGLGLGGNETAGNIGGFLVLFGIPTTITGIAKWATNDHRNYKITRMLERIELDAGLNIDNRQYSHNSNHGAQFVIRFNF